MSTATFVDIIIAILLPPLGVFLRFGCGVYLSIFLLITRLCFILINYTSIDIFTCIHRKIKSWNYDFCCRLSFGYVWF